MTVFRAETQKNKSSSRSFRWNARVRLENPQRKNKISRVCQRGSAEICDWILLAGRQRGRGRRLHAAQWVKVKTIPFQYLIFDISPRDGSYILQSKSPKALFELWMNLHWMNSLDPSGSFHSQWSRMVKMALVTSEHQPSSCLLWPLRSLSVATHPCWAPGFPLIHFTGSAVRIHTHFPDSLVLIYNVRVMTRTLAWYIERKKSCNLLLLLVTVAHNC